MQECKRAASGSPICIGPLGNVLVPGRHTIADWLDVPNSHIRDDHPQLRDLTRNYRCNLSDFPVTCPLLGRIAAEPQWLVHCDIGERAAEALDSLCDCGGGGRHGKSFNASTAARASTVEKAHLNGKSDVPPLKILDHQTNLVFRRFEDERIGSLKDRYASCDIGPRCIRLEQTEEVRPVPPGLWVSAASKPDLGRYARLTGDRCQQEAARPLRQPAPIYAIRRRRSVNVCSFTFWISLPGPAQSPG